MKELNRKYKAPPPFSTIEAARTGDAEAMEQILRHYDGYINKLFLRTILMKADRAASKSCLRPPKMILLCHLRI